MARTMLPILLSAIDADADEIKEVALRGLVDVIMTFGFDALVTRPPSTPAAAGEPEPAPVRGMIFIIIP